MSTLNSRPIRVRFAPSPTGYLHVGGARTALYNYLFARKEQGTFILRVEDTDLERSTEESMRLQIADLEWLGLSWDEGVDAQTLKDRGDKGPYRQSQRLEIYREQAEKLLREGRAYYCFHSDEEVAAQRDQKAGHFRSEYCDLPYEAARDRVAAGASAVVRFRNSETPREYKVQDLIRGEVVFSSELVGDFVIMRSNGMPVYNFCCAVDDGLMEISHVLRAEEHLNNTLRQLMIYEALNLEPPVFGHLSIILGADKQKLSKRHGVTSCNDYRQRGFLPAAMTNFMALLGWNPGGDQEVFSIDEMTELFSLDRFTPSAAVFDETKLKWMNSVHLRALPAAELWSRVQPLVDGELSADPAWQNQALELFKPKVETLQELAAQLQLLTDTGFELVAEADEVLSWESSKALIDKWIAGLESSPVEGLSEERFSELQAQIKSELGVKGKFLFMPLRVCVMGRPHGVDLQKVVPLMARDQLMARARHCQQRGAELHGGN